MLLTQQRFSQARARIVGIGARVVVTGPVAAAGIFLGPIPPPVPDVPVVNAPLERVTSVLPTAVPTLPATVVASAPTAIPTGQLPDVAPPAQAGTSAPASGAPAAPTSNLQAPHATETPRPGLPIPFTSIVISSPLDVALVGAIATLPLLLAIWLFLAARTLVEAKRARDSQVRLTLAADLGLRPRELLSISTKALFKLREQSAFDELTGTLRRAAGISIAERELARAQRHHAPLTIAFVDVDGLKEANDRKGHLAGDRLLRGVAQALKSGLRAQDMLLRFGGDEFICVLPDTTAEAGRAKLREVQSEAVRSGMRFTFGLAQLERGDDIVSLLARADRELYDFKARRGEIV
ncbi:MAG TPA: GGDEF domain-containing protein, partial [Sphingomonas sp.]|nr:GGDEF domain-containing protein [Sphingomonas sp.]